MPATPTKAYAWGAVTSKPRGVHSTEAIRQRPSQGQPLHAPCPFNIDHAPRSLINLISYWPGIPNTVAGIREQAGRPLKGGGDLGLQ